MEGKIKEKFIEGKRKREVWEIEGSSNRDSTVLHKIEYMTQKTNQYTAIARSERCKIETETKVITLTNHNRSKQLNESIGINLK